MGLSFLICDVEGDLTCHLLIESHKEMDMKTLSQIWSLRDSDLYPSFIPVCLSCKEGIG